MERHLRNVLYCQTFDSDAKHDSCIDGFCKTILEERVLDNVHTVTAAHGLSALHTYYIVIG